MPTLYIFPPTEIEESTPQHITEALHCNLPETALLPKIKLPALTSLIRMKGPALPVLSGPSPTRDRPSWAAR